jgi:hypothetical protein
MKYPLERVGGRKFIFAILVVILSFVLVITKTLPVITWLDFVTTIGGIYVIGNVVTKFTKQ